MNINKFKEIFMKALDLLLKPKEAWEKIATEPNDIKNIAFFPAIITLIPAFAMIIGYWIIGVPLHYGYFKMSFSSAFFSAFVFYLFSLTAVAITTFMIGFFANYFHIEGKWETYAKIACYSATAPILANIVYILPIIKFLKIVGFYGCITLFVGLPLLIKIPKDKEMQFVVTVIISAVIIVLVFSGLVDQFVGPLYTETL